MIPLIALMIGAYIITRMMIFLLRSDPHQSKVGIVINKILAVGTICIAATCIILIFLPSMTSFDMEKFLESEQPSELKEMPKIYEEPKIYIVIKKPSDLHMSDFSTRMPIGKIPVGTKLELIEKRFWKSDVVDLTILFYRVKHQGFYGWVITDNCELIRE